MREIKVGFLITVGRVLAAEEDFFWADGAAVGGGGVAVSGGVREGWHKPMSVHSAC